MSYHHITISLIASYQYYYIIILSLQYCFFFLFRAQTRIFLTCNSMIFSLISVDELMYPNTNRSSLGTAASIMIERMGKEKGSLSDNSSIAIPFSNHVFLSWQYLSWIFYFLFYFFVATICFPLPSTILESLWYQGMKND